MRTPFRRERVRIRFDSVFSMARDLARLQPERVDEPAKPKVTHHRPAELYDLLLVIVLQQFIEQRLVDVVVVDEQAFGVVQGGLLRRAQVGSVPAANLRDGLLFEGLSFP